jgi:hypothetical protein
MGHAMQNQDLVRIARRRAAAKFGFMIHLAAFFSVNALLFVINQSTTPGVSWFAFPLGGWAIGLAIHGLVVFLSVSGLHERPVEGELGKLQANRTPGSS